MIAIVALLLFAFSGDGGKALPHGVNRVGFESLGKVMHLSWNEKRVRAAKFAEEWKTAGYERGQSQTFYNEFFEIFGVKRRRVASFEEPVKKLGAKQGFIDLFWKGVLLVEQKSAGRNLTKAKQQAFDYFPGLKENELPRYILACDFQTFHLHDLDEGEDWAFGLQELPEKLKLFSFIDGGIQHKFKDEDPVNIDASALMGELHDELKAAGYEGHDLERFLVRLVFCLFADDTGIFDRGILTDYIATRTNEDGSDLGPKLAKLFEVLNTHEDKRQKNLDEELASFPYVNGDLFADRLSLPDFNSAMRIKLLEACHFDWSKVSPAIFGSLFQSVMDKKKRRAIGAHYTNEQNILKVIGPLFLDDLKAELAKLKARKDNGRTTALKGFQEKLSKITCFDPACGCGNFLVISYRELRLLETEVILDLSANNKDLFAGSFSQVDVDQFYGIEIEEFPARIAETALWMMDHIMNMRLSEALGEYLPRIPLKAKPIIKHADALEIDWASVLPPEKCSYVFGNPPFVGKHLMSPEQSSAVGYVFNNLKGVGNLDFVTAWFLLSARYIQNSRIECALVSTNSISQGEQVALIWRELFKLGIIINFAHRTFEWGSEAKGKAHVHCVIVGFGLVERQKKTIFEYPKIDDNPVANDVKRINPYLIEAGNILVSTKDSPPEGILPAAYGSKPVDNGNLLFTTEEKIDFVRLEPKSREFFKPIVSGDEFINGEERWAL